MLAAASCGRAPLTAPSGSAIRLVASTSALSLDGAAEITAFVLEGSQGGRASNGATEIISGSGMPVHDGTDVVFVTSLGRVEPSEARTRGGRATVRLIGDGRSGTATITAVSGAASSTIDVEIGAALARRLTVTAHPQTLPSIGGTALISARVEGQQGDPVPGVLVSFSTTEGTLSATAATTNDDGYASAILKTTAEATVTATSGGAGDLRGTVVVSVRPSTTVNITPPVSAMLGVPAAFTITPGAGTRITNVDVDFGDGTGVSLGAISSATNVSHIFRESGELTVEVTATDSDGEERTVATSVGVIPLTASGSSSPATTTAPEVGDTVTFTVTPAPGAAVDRYRWDFGDGTIRTTGSNQLTHSFSKAGPTVVTVRVFPFASEEFTTVLIVVDVKR
jgi:hypothetical protein